MKSREVQYVKTEAEAKLCFNRTGIMTNPELSAELIRGAKNTKPISASDAQPMAKNREQYINEGLPIGSAPIVVDGSETTTEEQLSADADRISVLLDKLGERLAFERQGTRLYEAFLQKLEIAPVEHNSGPSPEELRHICDEELKHFKLLQQAISGIGGDTTVQTPSADIAGVLSHGVVQIVSDPRTTIPQTLQAVLNAELADNDGWQLLKELARELGNSALEKQCAKALEEEQEHLANVRKWLSEMTLNEALGEDAWLESEGDDPERKKEDRGTRKRKRSTSSHSSKSRKRRKK